MSYHAPYAPPRRSRPSSHKTGRTAASGNLGEWDMRAYLEAFRDILPQETSSGVDVNEQTAMTYSAVWMATTFFSGMASTLPRKFGRLDESGKLQDADDHPLYRVFVEQPAPWLSAEDYFSLTIPWLINQGNIVNVKRYDAAGRVRYVIPVHPSRIVWGQIKPDSSDNRLRYPITLDDGSQQIFHQDDVFHVMGEFTRNGYIGEGVIPYANESVGMGLVTEKYGAKFFANDAHAGTVVSVEDILAPGPYERLKASWQEKTGLENAHMPVILEQGAKIDRLGIAPEQAQYLQTRKHNITEIARWYKLPVYFLKEMQDAGVRANVESESIQLVIYSLLPWLIRFERAARLQLLSAKDRRRFQFRFEVKGLLRGDSAARAAFYKEMFQTGAFTQNMILRLEDIDEDAGPDGDLRYVPANMMTVEQHKAATKQAKKLADAPAPNPNAAPSAPGESKDPADKGVPPEQQPNDRTAAVHEAHNLLLERLAAPPPTNGHAKHKPSRKASLRRYLCRIQNLQGSLLKAADAPGSFPDRVSALFDEIIPSAVPPKALSHLSPSLQEDRRAWEELYALPCQDLKAAVARRLQEKPLLSVRPAAT